MEFIRGTGKVFNTIHANTFPFYEELAHVLNREPVDFIDPELRGLAASIGIRKGQAFEPDERMKKILVEAIAVGNATHARYGCGHVTAAPSFTKTALGTPHSSAGTTAG